MNPVESNNLILKCQRYKLSGCNDIGIRNYLFCYKDSIPFLTLQFIDHNEGCGTFVTRCQILWVVKQKPLKKEGGGGGGENTVTRSVFLKSEWSMLETNIILKALILFEV